MTRHLAVALLSLSFTGCFVAVFEEGAGDPERPDGGLSVVLPGAPQGQPVRPEVPGPAIDGGAEVASAFDLVKDFSSSLNPSGAWGYGWSHTIGGFTPLMATTTNTCGTMPIWTGEGGTNIWTNLTAASTCFGVLPGQVSMHPGIGGEFAVVRFTAPTSGDYGFEAQFGSGDPGDTDMTITKNGAPFATLATTANSPTFSRTIVLVAGDTVDFNLGYMGDWSYDNTPISVHVTRR